MYDPFRFSDLRTGVLTGVAHALWSEVVMLTCKLQASQSTEVAPSTPRSTSVAPSTTPQSTTTSATATSSPTWTPTPTIRLETITGVVRTLTVTPTEPPTATAQPKKGTAAFFANAGKVAGLFVGLAVIILVTAGLLLFFCWRRRQSHAQLAGEGSTAGGSTPRPQSRSMSQLGLMNEVRQPNGVPQITTGMWGTAGPAADSPTAESERRNSRAKVVDQRLDPQSLWNPLHDNSSRISVRSLQDDRDYSRRVLKVRQVL